MITITYIHAWIVLPMSYQPFFDFLN